MLSNSFACLFALFACVLVCLRFVISSWCLFRFGWWVVACTVGFAILFVGVAYLCLLFYCLVL